MLPASVRMWVVEAHPAVRDMGDRERAELLALLLLWVVPLGLASGVVQLVFVPGFLPTFLAMAGALGVLALAYCLSRSRYWRLAGVLASLAPIVVCLAIGVANPDDHVWYAFAVVGVLMASVFIGAIPAAGLGVVTLIGSSAVFVWLDAPAAVWAPALAFQAVFMPLIVLASWHHRRMERIRLGELAQREAALAKARQMELLGQLAGGIAHDFNNLLTVVVGNVELLREAGPLPSEVEEIGEVTKQAAGLISQLLAYARCQQLNPKVVDLSQHLLSFQTLLRRVCGGSVQLRLELTEIPSPILVDQSQLERVVVNLVVNARDAMPDGGDLTLQTGVVTDRVTLSVRDQGHGMDPEVLERAFEPFFTTRGAGTGLGLATVHSIVAQHGGQIRVESSSPGGTTFHLEFPLVTPEPGNM